MRECLELIRRAGKTPSPGDFIDKFEGLLTAPTVDLATRLRGSNSVALEEMESVGSVSDFDDDWNANEAAAGNFEDEPISPIKRGIKTHDFNSLVQQKRSLPVGAIAAAAAVILGIGAWIFMGGKSAPEAAAQPVAAAAEAEGPVISLENTTPPVMAAEPSKPVPSQAEAVKPKPAPAV
ncbi:MAG: hypothetical protein B7Z21_01630, partial [Verrucomicrobiales bacterium 32-60-5]